MASAELLKMTRSVDGNVTGVDDRVKSVGDRVKGVEGKVQDVCDDVQDVGNKVQCVDDKIQGIGVDVNDKLDQVNRSLSLKHLLIIPSAHTASQGTSSEIVFRDGFPPQIHPLIITTHAKLITLAQPNGFFKAVFSTNGNPLDRSCGYTENVR